MVFLGVLSVFLIQNQLHAKFDMKAYYDQVAVTSLCEPEQYFYECFEKQNLCQQRMRTLVPLCLKENRNLAKDSPQLHLRMGLCLGNHFEKKYENDKKSQLKCHQTDSWTKND